MWLFDVAGDVDTEDDQKWVYGVGQHGVVAFTEEGIENLKENRKGVLREAVRQGDITSLRAGSDAPLAGLGSSMPFH